MLDHLKLILRRANRRLKNVYSPYQRSRKRIARKYLVGAGLEIGALHNPLNVPPHVKVTYVDRFLPESLKDEYPAQADFKLVPVDVIDDGEQLATFTDSSQDFIIANHFLEHTQDPIRTIQTFLRVLRPGGIIFLTVPNRRFTFDRHRAPTSWEHLERDHREGPQVSLAEHIRECVYDFEGLSGAAAEERIAFLSKERPDLHYHVWDDREFVDFLQRAATEFKLPCSIEPQPHVDFETAIILKKDLKPAIEH